MSGDRLRRYLRIFRRDPAAEVDDELDFHLDQRIRDYIDRGMDPESARRAVHERLGDLRRVRDECFVLLAAERRSAQRRARLNVSLLDVKLGLRMLAKYPGLSLVSVIGMAVAIAIGAGYFAFFGALLDSTLPLDNGDRIVSIRNLDVTQSPVNWARPSSVRDFYRWRDELKSVRDVSAFRSDRRSALRPDDRNLITSDGSTELVEVAAMTASGFRVARVSPLLGRAILEEDESLGAPQVIVIAYEEWQRRFDGDPDIIGRLVRLGATTHTVVGVMPEGFRFPIQHRYWVPLQLDPINAESDDRTSLTVFGRLADGSTFTQAQAELDVIGQRVAASYPETYEHLRPQVAPYTRAFFDVFDSPAGTMAFRAIQLAISLLLIIVAVNVAVLVYARVTTRTGEIAVRSALGASRRRVVTQLFVEALVMSLAAATIGLTVAGTALEIADDYLRRGESVIPFWIELGLSPGVIVYAGLLAIVAGGIIGVLPALKATSKRVQPALQQLSSRGSTMQLGRTWTAFIVVQVAVAVAVLPVAANYAQQSIRLGTRHPAMVTNDLLTATVTNDLLTDAMLVMQGDEAPARADTARERALRVRFAGRIEELVRRLEAEPAVSAVTFATRFPGRETASSFEVDGVETLSHDSASGARGVVRSWARVNHVAIDLFDVLNIPLLAGRPFVAADMHENAAAVIVNEEFAQRIAGGANVLGRRIRYARNGDSGTEANQWFEIVGVVPDFADDFTSPSSFDGTAPQVYHAIATSRVHPVALVVRLARGEAAGFAARLRDIAASVDPTLTLERLMTVAGAFRRAQRAFFYTALGIIAVTVSVLLLCAAGIYAMMSFTVAQRRREIGIRSALGADPRRLLGGVFARAGTQLGTGALAGLILSGALDHFGGTMGGKAAYLLPGVAVFMLAIGLLAALGPARRGLAIQPTEALREE